MNTYLVRVVTDDDCCTDEGTRRRYCCELTGISKENAKEILLCTYRNTQGEKEKSRKRGTKNKNIVLKASVVTKLPASATKPSRGPCHIFFLPSSATLSIKVFGGWR